MSASQDTADELVRQLRNACVDAAVAPSVLLRQTRVLAFELKQKELDIWAKRELEGYDGVVASELPAYRVLTMSPKGNFVGPFAHMKNAPIHTDGLPQASRKQFENALRTHYARGPIAEYEELLKHKAGAIHIDLSRITSLLSQNVYEGMECISAYGLVSKGSVRNIVEGIKNRILDLTIELSSRFPTGVTDYVKRDPKPISNVVNTVIHGGQPNIAIASDHFSQTVTVTNSVGDADSLRKALTDRGLSDADTKELVETVESEQPSGTQFGPRVAALV